MADINLNEKIRAELLKSGFPLEVKCRQTIYKRKWMITLSRFYLDSDNNEHEIDLIALKQTLSRSKKDIVLNSIIVLECKKNESNHWVFFYEGIGFPKLNLLSTLPKKYADNLTWLNEKSLKSHHYYKFKPASSYSMAFKSKHNQIFEALNQVYNAYKHEIATPESNMAKVDKSLRGWVNIYYPVIVLDGKLFLAQIIKDNLEVEEVRQALYVAHRPAYFKYPYSIDIVTADTLSDYLDMLDTDHDTIFSYIESLSS